MRVLKSLSTLVTALLLAGCVSSLLVGNQLQSRLMWAFIEPLVGFNPNEINFFEAPLVKDRMTALLGDKYEPAMKLLRTANQIQQEGALYYVVSRYAPPQAQAVVDTAGLVWNADTNQMAVLLVQDGIPDLVAEQAQAAAAQAIEPVLPAELKTVYDSARSVQAAVDSARQLPQRAVQRVEDEVEAAVEQEVEEQVHEQVDEQVDDVIEESDDPLLDLIRQRKL